VLAFAVGWVVVVFLGGFVVLFGAGFVAVAGAVAGAWAGYKLQKSFSKAHTFLILASTSNLGLGLGWLGHSIFNKGS
ncbi:MAG: serine/threonine protein kinase, partial [Nostoc sp. DedQUE12a]|nr:serine/threonine protein kinase [Nostoc sp. DedQUE12a]